MLHKERAGDTAASPAQGGTTMARTNGSTRPNNSQLMDPDAYFKRMVQPDTRPGVWRWEDIAATLDEMDKSPKRYPAYRRFCALVNNDFEGAPGASPAVFMGVQRIHPGEHVPAHRHNSVAIYYWITGSGKAIVGDEEIRFKAGDFFSCPAWHAHEFFNDGDEDMIMIAVHDLPLLAHELAAAKVDVIVTTGFPPALAAKATGLPTVAAAGVGDPVATGLIETLARPGTNVTGISDDAGELSTKRLGVLKELLPQLRRVAMLWNQDDLGMSLRYKASSEAAAGLGVAVQALGVREPDDFNIAFAAMDHDRPDAILMVSDSLTVLNRKRVFDYAAAHSLPAIYESEMYVRDGGLMSYGADSAESYRRAAGFVDQILRGAKTAELPFERPTRYVFAINLRTAIATSIQMPPLLLARADAVIE